MIQVATKANLMALIDLTNKVNSWLKASPLDRWVSG